MGLFGKKYKDIDVRAMYYDGELPNFIADHACRIILQETDLILAQSAPKVEVRLERSRVQSIEQLPEVDYMLKYKGASGRVYGKGEVPRSFFVIHYVTKNGTNQHVDFWGTSMESIKIMKLQQRLIADQKPTSYEI